MKRLIIAVGLTLLLLTPAACAQSESDRVPSEAPTPAPIPEPAASPETSGGGIIVTGVDSAVSEERMIVRTGDISVRVNDVISARDEIARLAVTFGGYVVSAYISGDEEDRRGNITIRVPDDKYDQALTEIRNLAVRVTSESTESQDVTEQYIDLQSRLKNAEATESQYLALLEKADDVEDILRVYEHLSQIRQEIEQLKGQIQYLERVSSMSLISISLRPETSDKPLVRAGWNALEILKSAVRGLVITAQVIATIAIGLLVFIPIWGTGIGVFIWLRRRKRRKAAG